MRGNLYFLSTRDEEDIFTRDITSDTNQSKNIQDRKLFCLGLTAGPNARPSNGLPQALFIVKFIE